MLGRDVAAMGHVCDDASAVDLTLSVSNVGTPGYQKIVTFDPTSAQKKLVGSRSQLYSSAPPLTRKERTPFGNGGGHMLEYLGTSLETDGIIHVMWLQNWLCLKTENAILTEYFDHSH